MSADIAFFRRGRRCTVARTRAMDPATLLHTWGFALLGGVLVLVAFIVNRVAPKKRYRIRHGLILYALYLTCAGAAWALGHVAWGGVASWAEHIQLFADLFGAFTLVNLRSLAVFDVVLPAVGVDLGRHHRRRHRRLRLRLRGARRAQVGRRLPVLGGHDLGGRQRRARAQPAGHARQHPRRRRAAARRQRPRRRLGPARRRHAGQGRGDPLAPHGGRDAQLGHGHRPELEPARAEHPHPRQAHGQPVQHRMWVYFNVDFRYAPVAASSRWCATRSRRAHRGRRRRSEAERHLLRLRQGRARQLRLLRRALLADRSRRTTTRPARASGRASTRRSSAPSIPLARPVADALRRARRGRDRARAQRHERAAHAGARRRSSSSSRSRPRSASSSPIT